MTDETATPAETATDHVDLPLPDYDHLTVGDLTGRIRSLDLAQVRTVLAYELQHAARQPVLAVLETRIGQLEDGGEPSAAGPQGATPPVWQAPPSGGSPVSPATSGPPVNPPSHGDPTNPAQPRS